MKIDSNRVKKLRAANNWSQEQLSEASGLSLRTIQRLENGGNASIESIRALAAAFNIDHNKLILSEADNPMTPLDAVESGLRQFSDFSGTATRFEYWWFLAFVVVVAAIATIINEQAYQITGVIFAIPLIAVGTRRLHDTGNSGWWQLFILAPFGLFIVLYMMTLESSDSPNMPITKSLDAA